MCLDPLQGYFQSCSASQDTLIRQSNPAPVRVCVCTCGGIEAGLHHAAKFNFVELRVRFTPTLPTFNEMNVFRITIQKNQTKNTQKYNRQLTSDLSEEAKQSICLASCHVKKNSHSLPYNWLLLQERRCLRERASGHQTDQRRWDHLHVETHAVELPPSFISYIQYYCLLTLPGSWSWQRVCVRLCHRRQCPSTPPPLGRWPSKELPHTGTQHKWKASEENTRDNKHHYSIHLFRKIHQFSFIETNPCSEQLGPTEEKYSDTQ